MAIWSLQESAEEAGAHRHPHLRLVTEAPASFRTGADVGVRRCRRRARTQLRRRAAFGGGVVITLVLLAWPGHAFGGVSSTGVPVDGPSAGPLVAGSGS